MNKNDRFVITINRELGSGGRTVGRILAEKLGVPYYDKALTKPLEEKFDMTLDQIEKLKGNNRSWWEEIKRVLIWEKQQPTLPSITMRKIKNM